MNHFTLYIIYSRQIDKYYIGYTSDLEKRMKEHGSGISTYTSKATDWILKYTELFPERGQAMAREKEIKKKKSRSYIEWLVNKSK